MEPIENLGKKGEKIAQEYLKEKGYQILERNWLHGHREIDIIAREADEIVIVEVKSRGGYRYEEPWEAVSKSKIKNLVIAANAWLIQRSMEYETRFDVISIVFLKDGSYELTHFKGAFIPPVN